MSTSQLATATHVDPLAAVIDEQLSVADATVRELLAACRNDDPMHNRLQQVHQTMQRLATLTGQCSVLGRRRPHRATPLDLNGTVQQMAPALQRLLGPFITLQTALHPPGVWASGDRGKVEQVILGLVINAREALPLGGKVRLTTEHRLVDHRQDYRIGSLPAGAWAMLGVSDSGNGIDEQAITYLLEPSLHGVPFDSSLSLATMSAIVRGSGGHVLLDTAGGTTFSVCFPATAAPRSRQPATGVAGAVLIVDDDEWTRLSSARALRRAGYGVLDAGDTDTAIELLSDVAGSCVRLAVVDARLRSATGRPLSDLLRAEHPGLDLIVTVGAMPGRPAPARSALLAKPFSSDDLVRAVRERFPLNL